MFKISNFFRVRIERFELVQNGKIVKLPSSQPYLLDAALYNNGPQTPDASLKFFFYLCRADLLLPEKGTTTLVDFEVEMARNCYRIEESPNTKQNDASHASVLTRSLSLNVSDTETGLDFLLNAETYPFCWKHAQLLALLYSDLTEPYQVRSLCSKLQYLMSFNLILILILIISLILMLHNMVVVRDRKNFKIIFFVQKERIINLDKNLKRKLIFVDCGSRVQDECKLGLSQCPTNSSCLDLYYGYACVCLEGGKILDQFGNCVAVEKCDGDQNGNVKLWKN